MPRLAILLLGRFEVHLEGIPLTFSSDKARALLAYLAVEGDTVHRRGKLADLLWPDSTEKRARHSLSQALYDLRRTLERSDADPPFLLIHAKTIQFNRASDHWLDTSAFADLVRSAAGQPNAGLSGRSIIDQLEDAVALYRGPLLEDVSVAESADFENWLQYRREGFHRLAMRALRRLVRIYVRQGEYFWARQHAWRQLELAPCQEDVHHQMIHLLHLSGRRSEALVQYEVCRRVLKEQLGVEPSPETQALYAQIRGEGNPLKLA